MVTSMISFIWPENVLESLKIFFRKNCSSSKAVFSDLMVFPGTFSFSVVHTSWYYHSVKVHY